MLSAKAPRYIDVCKCQLENNDYFGINSEIGLTVSESMHKILCRNLDFSEHRIGLLEKSWDRSKDLVIFDELHKMKNWKSWRKGIYDAEGMPPSIVVTGSAKLETYRKVGDALAGRFFQFRLHPLDLKEIHNWLSIIRI